MASCRNLNISTDSADEPFKLLQESSKNKEGEILAIENDSIVVGCAKGTIRIFSVQAPSKKEIDIISYINGKRLTLEDSLS